ncbi:MAG TPA: AAA family ATPase [Micromonosporaceae bacterium]|nr:AAA family ATPase [Micromonosporaceae bacterium]
MNGWGEPAAVRETHVATVFLTGDRAYKVKKPVDVGFLDFRTRASRLAACRREVELNRRLAPDVYLGVADVSDVDGLVCDHMVVMRRMPTQRRLSTLVANREPVADTVTGLARMIAAFHAGARRAPEISAQGTRDAIAGRWEDSFAQVHSLGEAVFGPGVLDEIVVLTRKFLAGRAALFDARVAAGRIVDGHGDLLADDVFCLEDGPRVLDCLEFDDRLRFLDGLDDIAFLAMDLDRLGAPELGELLLDRYAEFAGDPAPPALRAHYQAYRAFVRAKVACLRHDQGDAAAAAQAATYAELTLRHLRRGQVRLILVGGLPGTGKSTLAGQLADRLGAVLLSSDRLRKEQAAINPHDRAAAPFGDGIYTPAHTERVYTELLHRAEQLLGHGETVILDASWTRQTHRDAAAALATRTHSELRALRCTAPAPVTTARLRERTGTPSDADDTIATAMTRTAQPWPEATDLDTTGAPAQTVATALAVITGPELPVERGPASRVGERLRL